MSVGIWKSLKVQHLDFFGVIEARIQGFQAQFVEQARESLLSLAESLMEKETCEKAGVRYGRHVAALKGPKTPRVVRAGSDPATVRIGNQRVLVRKQRLKRGNEEVPLESYQALRRGDLLTARVLDCMVRGLSTRDYDELLEEIAGGLGLSKSSVSRAFIDGSRQALEALQTRSLEGKIWAAVQVDAIYFAGRSLVVALGIDASGHKMILGLREGNTESAQLCSDLFSTLIERKFRTDLPFLFVLDGGKGLRKAVSQMFGERFPVQRCLIHKARNLEEYLPKRLHPESRRRFARLRRCERFSDAKLELKALRHWCQTLSSEADASLAEAGEELLTIFRYDVGHLLKRSLCSTNLIESTFSQVRRITARVKNWSHPRSRNKDQIKRWAAMALLMAEKKSNYVKGQDDLTRLLVKLHHPEEKRVEQAAQSA